MAFQLHQKGSCTDCISEEFPHSLHLFFFLRVFLFFFFKGRFLFFLFFVLQAQNGYSGTRKASAGAGRSAPPRFNILRSKEKNPKNMKSKQKTNKQKNSSRIDHLGKRLVPSGQTVLLDFSYSNRGKKKFKKKKIIKKKFVVFFFYPEQLVNNTNLQAPSHSSTGRSFTTRFHAWVSHTRASTGTLPIPPSVHVPWGSSRPNEAVAGRVLGQAGLIGQQVMCKDRVVP